MSTRNLSGTRLKIKDQSQSVIDYVMSILFDTMSDNLETKDQPHRLLSLSKTYSGEAFPFSISKCKYLIQELIHTPISKV